MAKAYKIEMVAFTEEFTARQWVDARSRARQTNGDARYFLKGEEVDYVTFVGACNDALDAWWKNKETTHKRISVQHGVLPTSRVWIWVRK